MARANLSIDQELISLFERASASGNVRCIRASIEGERITICGDPPEMLAEGSSSEDFEMLASEKSSPRYYLWNEDTSSPGNWCLVAYVTEDCRVREKMLYASCHKDLVNALGATSFKGECYMNDPKDFVHQEVLSAMRSSLVNAPLTEAEIASAAEAKASIGQDTIQAGMSTLPFQLTDSAVEKLNDLKSGSANFVCMLVNESEHVDAVEAKSLEASGEIPSTMDDSNGRFYAMRFPIEEGSNAKLFFVLSVPDSTPVKQRMILATVKSTVLERCSALGLNFSKMLEVQDVADIISDLKSEIAALTEDRSLKNDVAFSKPKGPPRRRGKRRLMKKKTTSS